MKSAYKILIISGYNINGTDGTSITLKNLFLNYDKDKIARIYFNYSDLDENSDEKLFIISQKHIRFRVKKTNKDKNIIINKNITEEKINSLHKFYYKIFNTIRIIINSYSSLNPTNYTKQLDSFIKNFNPDLIYTPFGEIPLLKLVLKISKKHNLPIIPHFMDDWISTKYTNNFLLIIPKLVLAKSVNDIMERSKIAFAISEKMAIEYEEKFKKKFLPLMNCVEEIEIFEGEVEINKSETIRFCYAGGLHLNRWESLLFLCESLKSYPFSKPFTLTIFTKDSDWIKYENLFSNYIFVKYGGFIPQEQVMKELKNQNILVHIESFDKHAAKYTRLSISTKIPEYLSLKKAILAIGPADIASIEYLKNNKSAFIIEKQESDLLNIELNKILNQDMYNNYSENAYQLFLKNHTRKSQQNLLLNNLKF